MVDQFVDGTTLDLSVPAPRRPESVNDASSQLKELSPSVLDAADRAGQIATAIQERKYHGVFACVLSDGRSMASALLRASDGRFIVTLGFRDSQPEAVIVEQYKGTHPATPPKPSVCCDSSADYPNDPDGFLRAMSDLTFRDQELAANGIRMLATKMRL